MNKWEAVCYDLFMKLTAKSKLMTTRKNIIQQASGKALEIGSGSGINFPLYDQIDSLDAVEPNWNMIEKSFQRKKQASIPITIHKALAEDMPFLDHTFDSIINTLVFCTIPNPMDALKEVQRVAKPNATVLFLEHVKMKHPLLANIQNVLTPSWKLISNGCHLNRNTLGMIQNSGLRIKNVKSHYNDLLIAVVCVNSSINHT